MNNGKRMGNDVGGIKFLTPKRRGKRKKKKKKKEGV